MKYIPFLLLISFQTWAMDAEVKLSVTASNLSRVLESYGLDEEEPEEAEIYFFDTANRKLYKQGLFLRARLKAEDSDITVKIRPCDNDDLDQELDYNSQKQVISCALDADVSRKEIKASINGNQSIKKLFPAELETLANDYADYDWSNLEVIGPIQSKKWKTDEVSVELWKFKEQMFLEISKKTGSDKAAQEFKTLLKHATKNQIQINNEVNKTAWVFKR